MARRLGLWASGGSGEGVSKSQPGCLPSMKYYRLVVILDRTRIGLCLGLFSPCPHLLPKPFLVIPRCQAVSMEQVPGEDGCCSGAQEEVSALFGKSPRLSLPKIFLYFMGQDVDI